MFVHGQSHFEPNLRAKIAWLLLKQYHGGTNFGRTTGGPFIATSYDYDAPIDEYGMPPINLMKLLVFLSIYLTL